MLSWVLSKLPVLSFVAVVIGAAVLWSFVVGFVVI